MGKGCVRPSNPECARHLEVLDVAGRRHGDCRGDRCHLYEFNLSPIAEVRNFWRGTLIQGRSMGILLALMCGFMVSLIISSLRLRLY